MKHLNTNYTPWEKTVHFFGMIWFILKEIGKLLTKRWFWLTLAFILWSYGIAWFNSNYQIKASWKFGIYERTTTAKKPTVMTVQAKEEKKPIVIAKTEEEIVKEQKHGEILWNIYQLETQRGKTDFCRKIGTFGGFGVKNDKNEIHCYMTFKEAAERASYWFGTHYPSKTLVDALCTWNKGTKERPTGGYMNCWYYQEYMKL